MITYTFLKKNLKFVLFLLVFLSSLILLSVLLSFNKTGLQVAFLNVGQGDSVYIRFPNRNNLLIDAGLNGYTINKIDAQKVLLDKEIKNVLLTHPDGDHVGGAEEVIKRENVTHIFLAKGLDYKDYTKDKDVKLYSLVSGDKINFDDMVLKILNPQLSPNNTETNHNSIVSLLDYGQISFLFMGDSDKETERIILAKNDLDYLKDKVLILKIGHHGSNTSSSESFLKALKPEYCVISVGKDNSYGHPTAEVMIILNKHCGAVYRTDVDGNIVFYTDGERLDINIDNK